MTIAPLQADIYPEAPAEAIPAPTPTVQGVGTCSVHGAAVEVAGELELLPANPTAARSWVDIDRKTPARRKRQHPVCGHTNEVLVRIDLDEIGEPDDTPTRAMVCLGCEAVRWV
jgi:hypothetical protein